MRAKTYLSFRSNRGHLPQNGARTGRIRESGAGKCPDSGCSEPGTGYGFSMRVLQEGARGWDGPERQKCVMGLEKNRENKMDGARVFDP